MLLTARYVVPVDQPPIENGAVLICEGRIAAVGRAMEFPSQLQTDYGDAVILPGFVNAHTHLELTHLEGQVPPSEDFVDWIGRLTRMLVAAPPTQETVEASVRRGIELSLAAGVTMVGDITRSPGWVRPVLGGSWLRGVSFGEVVAVGRLRRRCAARLEEAASATPGMERMVAGISPHAPYTLEPDGLRACADRAEAMRTPLCIHAAESLEEAIFTKNRTGPLADFLKAVGVWDDAIPCSGVPPIELCRMTGVLGPRTILAHANYVSDDDIAKIAASGASVAYCPRTHAAFGHAPHRFRDMLHAGINVCIGTDSLASNPSLSILDELHFLRRKFSDVAPHDWLTMSTLRGARALALDAVAGSLTVGRSADLVVFPLASGQPWDAILDEPAAPLQVSVEGRQTSLAG